MKKIIALSVLVLMSVVAFAQNTPVPKWVKNNAENYVEFATKEWKLSKEQQEVIYDYRLDLMVKRSQVYKQKKEGELTQEEAKTKIQAIQKEASQKFTKYLNIKWKEYYRVDKAFNEAQKAKKAQKSK
ncbi:hypothetical protein [Flammeovirga aprica]|uniref:DUF4890 domain-containing protein n=1 Tax=Flammeovirga aprica JL-4 TaxID=694437 RepID=A0A7X9P1I3_9BACT|nr:hypothetical protein [Flammeovirga aprica]NME67793.1 hypothetical protein [Flammeovirga aprica JL-4]